MTYKSTSFKIHKGKDYSLNFTVTNKAGTIIDLTPYTKIRFTVKKSPTSLLYTLRKATLAVSGGADAQLKITDATNGLVSAYILKDDFLTRATCTLVTGDYTTIANDEGFTLYDGTGVATVFKFSLDGGSVTDEDVTISVTSGDTHGQVAVAIVSAIDGTAMFSAPAAVAGSTTSTITVTQRIPGTNGNQTSNTDTVTSPIFALSIFAGGLDTPEPGTYYYELEIEHTANATRHVPLQDTFALLPQLSNWDEI